MAKNQESGKASPILEGAWDEYRDWAALARQSKRELRRWRIIVLVLGVIGAALETLAATSIGKSFVYGDFNVLAILGFVSLALAAFFGRNVGYGPVGGRGTQIGSIQILHTGPALRQISRQGSEACRREKQNYGARPMCGDAPPPVEEGRETCPERWNEH
jgi:hypothetical protein